MVPSALENQQSLFCLSLKFRHFAVVESALFTLQSIIHSSRLVKVKSLHAEEIHMESFSSVAVQAAMLTRQQKQNSRAELHSALQVPIQALFSLAADHHQKLQICEYIIISNKYCEQNMY